MALASFYLPKMSICFPNHVLAVNRGSSSLKVAVYDFANDAAPALVMTGKVDRIGDPQATFTVNHVADGTEEATTIAAPTHREAAGRLLDWLQQRAGQGAIAAVGHRIVHGGPRYAEPALVTAELLDELRRISPFDPDHLPVEIGMIEAVTQWSPEMPQVACFDTAFHHGMPRVAQLLSLPRKYDRVGIRRYGFHGLSYAYLMEELQRLAGREAAQGRIVLAHLGAGRAWPPSAKAEALTRAWDLRRRPDCRWPRAPATSIPGWSRSWSAASK